MWRKLAEYGIEREEIREIGNLWKKYKWPNFKEVFGGRTRIIEKIDLWDTETFKYYLRIFRENFGIDTGTITIEEWKSGRTKSGERLGKYLAKTIPPEKRDNFLREWDAFRKSCRIVGYLIISCNPRDLFFLSDPADWSSCHAFGRDFFLANFSYSTDPYTFIVYLAKDLEKDPEYSLPRKIWRILGYFFPDKDLLILSRQYPYESRTLYDFVRDKLLKIFFPAGNVRVSRPSVRLEIDPELDENRDFVPYFDYSYFVAYATEIFYDLEIFYFSPIVKSRIFRNHERNLGFCGICGEEIDLDRDNFEELPSGEIVCIECFNNYFRRCDICDEIIDLERDNFYSTDYGEIICENCFNEKFAICDNCGNPFYIGDGNYLTDDLGHFICPDCGKDLEIKECPNCSRKTYIIERVHENYYCPDCAGKIRNIYREKFLLLPFFDDPLDIAIFSRKVLG